MVLLIVLLFNLGIKILVGKAVKEAEDTRNPLNAFLNSAKTRFFGYGDKFVRVDSNGEEHHAGLPTGNKEPYIGSIDYVDSLKSKNDAVLDGGQITSSTIGICQSCPCDCFSFLFSFLQNVIFETLGSFHPKDFCLFFFCILS